MSIPTEVLAIFATRPGGSKVLESLSVSVPQPAVVEVLIEVKAAGINRPELRQRQGNYAPPRGITEVLGLEVAGEVIAVGEGVDRGHIGTEVCALVARRDYAQYCVAPLEQVLPKPAKLSFIEAAAIPETFFTVWANLFRIGRIQNNESVLIHSGASGIGMTTIQLAKAFGARVLCTAGKDHKLAACRRIGADAAINYRHENFDERVLEETSGRDIDVILDIVRASYAESNLKCLAVGGRLIIIAFLGGGEAIINLEQLVRRRQVICGSTLRSQNPSDKG